MPLNLLAVEDSNFCTKTVAKLQSCSLQVGRSFGIQMARRKLMIKGACEIYLKGRGFCWCPSSAWNETDEKLCQLCRVKTTAKMSKKGSIFINNPAIFKFKKEKERPYRVAVSA